MLFGDIKRAVAATPTSSSSTSTARPTTARGPGCHPRVFLKVLNELQGYCGDHPQIAHMERYLESKGKLEEFQAAFQKPPGTSGSPSGTPTISTGTRWSRRSARPSAERGFREEMDRRGRGDFALSVENFCKWAKEYLDAKGPQHRLIFLVDEVGQFIGTDSHLMLNLQTITEELGTICRGRAWVIVTSQEDIDAVLGEMRSPRRRTSPRSRAGSRPGLSLSSANVDEVIQARLLEKRPT